MDRTAKIRQINDTTRMCLCGLGTGKLVWTDAVRALSEEQRQGLLGKVVEFNAFNDDNDPHHEHDFGAVEHAGQKWFWKIDYYAKDDFNYGSEDPADPAQTSRVLTLMRADEY